VATRLLAIEVTGPGGGAALLVDDSVTVRAIPPEVRRGRSLVPGIAALLAEAGIAPEDLDGIACGVGPGSFTGIRIGVATAATLAYAADLPVLDVGSLHGIAANAPESAHSVLVALDARRGRVFAARFARTDDGLVLEGEYRNAPPDDVLAGLSPDTWVLGDARRVYPDTLDSFPGDADAPVRPDVIARLARARFAAGEAMRPDQLKPLYLRLSDPEIRAQIQ
jgi:tRNA threonylcarbamoyladenosine biosynthesis protein TsaB